MKCTQLSLRFWERVSSSYVARLHPDLEKQFGVYSSTILPLLSDITLRAPSTTLGKNKDLVISSVVMIIM